jgi:hypothetical protein
MNTSLKRPLFVGASLAFIVSAAIVSGCSSTSAPTVAAGSSATSAPTATPTTSSNPALTFPCGTVTANGTGTANTIVAGTAVNFPALGSCSSSITFSSNTTVTSGTSVNVTTSLTAPTGAPSPLPTNPSGTNAPTTIEFVTLAVTAGGITVPTGNTAGPAQAITLANVGSCKTYFQSFATGGAWQGFGNAGTLTGATVNFPAGQNSNAVTLSQGNTYFLVFACF